MARLIGSFSARRDKDFINDMTQEQRQQWAKEIMGRMMKAWGLKEQKEVAEKVNCHYKMPANWVQTFSIPWSVIYTCHLDTGRSLDWLYNGEISTNMSTPDIQSALIDATKVTLKKAIYMNLIDETSRNGLNILTKRLVQDLQLLLACTDTGESKSKSKSEPDFDLEQS